MSSGLHLSHKLPWNQLLTNVLGYEDPGIELPVGPCGLIHLDKKKTQIQLDYRNYLENQVCTISECPTTDSRIFRKSRALRPAKYIFASPARKNDLNKEKELYKHFLNCFKNTIEEFSATERQKVTDRKLKDPSEISQFWQNLKAQKKINEHQYFEDCDCLLFTTLMELGDTDTLLSFPNSVIEGVLRCQHGGQAVGNNISFLTYHVLKVYLYTNLIICAELTDKPETWGPMCQDSFFRRQLMMNCDGQTFLDSSRKYLNPEIYMKDWNGMKELLKECFKFLYFLNMLRKEVGLGLEHWNDLEIYFSI